MLDFHNLSAAAVLQKLKTNANGLTTEIAEKRLKKHGLNAMPEAKPLSGLLIFLSQLKILSIAGCCLFRYAIKHILLIYLLLKPVIFYKGGSVNILIEKYKLLNN